MDRGDRSIADEGGRVIDRRTTILRKPDHDGWTGHLPAHFLQSRLDLPAKAAVKEQVLGRVTRQRQLRIEDEIRSELRTSLAGGLDHTLGVAVDVPDEQIELGECDPEYCVHSPAAVPPAAVAYCFTSRRIARICPPGTNLRPRERFRIF